MQHLQPNATLQGGKYRIERVLGQGGKNVTTVSKWCTNTSQPDLQTLLEPLSVACYRRGLRPFALSRQNPSSTSEVPADR